MNQTANRLRHIHNEAAIASQSNPFEVMMNGLKEEFGCVSQRYDAIMDIALFYIADELDELQAKVDGLRKQVPSERERHILDMWPRFEDGEPVMFGDRFIDHRVNERTVRSVIVNDDGVELRTFDGTFDWHETGERVKRTVQRVLDADGVEIKVGDTVSVEGEPPPVRGCRGERRECPTAQQDALQRRERNHCLYTFCPHRSRQLGAA